MFERFDAFFEDVLAETVANENTFAEAERVAFVVKRFEVDGGVGADDRKTDCVGTGVNRGDVNRF